MTDTRAGKSSKKRIHRLRIIAASLLVLSIIISVAFMQRFMSIPNSYDEYRMVLFHKEPTESIDVLMIGSSATYSSFSSAYAYEQFGFTSFPYAIRGATCTSWKPSLVDALRTQMPKLIVVDVFGGGYDNDVLRFRNSQLYTIMNYMPLSIEKLHLAEELSVEVDRTSTSSLLFPFIKCHTNVPKNIATLKERLNVERMNTSVLKGIEVDTRTRKLNKVDEASFTDESVPLDKEAEDIILDFIDYCKNENVDVLFVKYPSVLTEQNPSELIVNKRANRILELAEEAGYSTLNMQKEFYTIGLDEETDFYNHGHPNTRGQMKITKYLGSYIKNEKNIEESPLSSSEKSNWDESVIYYKALLELSEELQGMKKTVDFGDSSETTAYLKRIIDGEDIRLVAEDCPAKKN